MATTVGHDQLLGTARLFMSIYDLQGLRRYLNAHWGTAGLVELLRSERTDVAKVAALGLGTLGDVTAVPALIETLVHDDAVVNAMAEYALWTIWFGECGPQSESRLRRAAHVPYDRAVGLLDQLIADHPDWIEPLNQRAISHFRNRSFVPAMQDCRGVLDANHQHFGALAGLGHSYAQLGCYGEAESCYLEALRIHPRLSGIRQSLRTVRNLQSRA